MKKTYLAAAMVSGFLALSPLLALAQTQGTFEIATPPQDGVNMMYGTVGSPVKTMTTFPAQGIALRAPMMNQFEYRTFVNNPHEIFIPFGFIVCGITILMLWILMALAIIWLATHLKKNMHKKE
jgi:hypothetical protein